MRQKLLERSGPGALLVSDDWWGARMDWPVPEAPRRRPQSCLSGQLLRLDQVFLLEYYILYKAHWMPHVEVRVAANVPPPPPAPAGSAGKCVGCPGTWPHRWHRHARLRWTLPQGGGHSL